MVIETTYITKRLLATCMCTQLLKMIKFTEWLVPKMSLLTSVLRRCHAAL